MEIGQWLRGLGLQSYEQAFRDNGIDLDVLPRLTADDLKEIGVLAVGHRRKLLEAIGELATRASVDQPGPMVPDHAERRQLTVTFCDLVGSTALSGRLDPEDLQELLSAYHALVKDVVRACDGYIAKFMGDGVLVYFGYPQAHEDDAERAVRAGLSLVKSIGQLDKFRPPDIAQRKNVRFRGRSGSRDGGGGGADLDRRAWEGKTDTRWRTHGEAHPQARAGEDSRGLVEHFAEGLGGAGSMRRAERSQGDMQLAIGDADITCGGK